MESQIKPKKVPGTIRLIAKKTNSSEHYVRRVIKGRVKQNGKKAKAILAMALEVEKIYNQLDNKINNI